jgi:hypothetical protein
MRAQLGSFFWHTLNQTKKIFLRERKRMPEEMDTLLLVV